MDLPSRVGRLDDFLFFNLFFTYGSRNMTPITQKFRENFDIFCRKKIAKIFRLIFKKFQPKFSDLGQKKS